VAFEFLDTRVLGVPWPGYRNFAELNLRFYVHRKLPDGTEERGVQFVREFVPLRLVAWMARFLYNEPYLAAPLTATRQEDGEKIILDYRLRFAGREHRISVTGGKPAFRPAETSDEHFFKEHRWGFGTTRSGQGMRYEVDHPAWDVYPVLAHQSTSTGSSFTGPNGSFSATPPLLDGACGRLAGARLSKGQFGISQPGRAQGRVKVGEPASHRSPHPPKSGPGEAHGSQALTVGPAVRLVARNRHSAAVELRREGIVVTAAGQREEGAFGHRPPPTAARAQRESDGRRPPER